MIKYISVFFLLCHSTVLAAPSSISAGKWYSQPGPSKLFEGDGCYQIELLKDGTAFFRLLMLEDPKPRVFQEVKGIYTLNSSGATIRFPDVKGNELLLSLSDRNLLIENPKAKKIETYISESDAPWAKPRKKAEQGAAANP
jgi:hypothetical protein